MLAIITISMMIITIIFKRNRTKNMYAKIDLITLKFQLINMYVSIDNLEE